MGIEVRIIKCRYISYTWLPGSILSVINLFHRYLLKASYVLGTTVLDIWKHLIKINVNSSSLISMSKMATLLYKWRRRVRKGKEAPRREEKRKTHIHVSTVLCAMSHLRTLISSTVNTVGWLHDTVMYPRLTKHVSLDSLRKTHGACMALPQPRSNNKILYISPFYQGLWKVNKCKF